MIVGGESFSYYFQSTGRKIIILTSSTLFSLEEGPSVFLSPISTFSSFLRLSESEVGVGLDCLSFLWIRTLISDKVRSSLLSKRYGMELLKEDHSIPFVGKENTP
jgi:hypothetical protein